VEERAADPVYALGRDSVASVPRAFVAVDISTNQGRDTVGSLVWFEAGRPKKSEYRRYRIRGPQQDDFAAVREVVSRFLRRRLEEEKPLPELMVIDGGKGQLAAAQAAAAEAGLATLPLASLAKREEEIFLPGREELLRLSRRSPSLKLLQRARDEAHRFAVSYSRRKRRSGRSPRNSSRFLVWSAATPHAARAVWLRRRGPHRHAGRNRLAPGFSHTLAERVLERLERK
jgi:excinuclease ABC subunit C